MKIISWNVNGLRAVYKRDFLGWLNKHEADIVCLQEIKCTPEQLADDIRDHDSYHLYFNPAKKPGYSGVAVFTKEKPLKVETELGHERFDREGRILRMDFKKFTLLNLYLPHGGRKKENLKYKLEVYKKLFEYLKEFKDKKVVLIGDFNVAHTELDLARPKNNQDNIMFTPEERAQIDKLIGFGYIDTFRVFNKEGGHFTWWSYMRNPSGIWTEDRTRERERNIGWRIDYAFASKSLKSKLKDAFILPEDMGSDHSPVGIEL